MLEESEGNSNGAVLAAVAETSLPVSTPSASAESITNLISFRSAAAAPALSSIASSSAFLNLIDNSKSTLFEEPALISLERPVNSIVEALISVDSIVSEPTFRNALATTSSKSSTLLVALFLNVKLFNLTSSAEPASIEPW